jgi:hypothetical protein
MPTGSLPESGKKLWERVYEEAKKGSCKDAKDVEACAAAIGWTAIKNAGWKKDAEGNWHKKAELQEFSLRLEKVSLDKPSGEMHWRMVASDTDADSYNDSMSLELFNDFISRAESGEQVPEDYRSDFWSGGMPYLSVSHYPDLNGDAVPGVVDAIYVDGTYFKAKGRYNDSSLGRACFKAVLKDLYNPERSEANDKIRVSIAFLDWAHTHKSNGYEFEREDENGVCIECLNETLNLMANGKTPQGKIFTKGHLVHLAHTRVPVNNRTSLEVDKSMTTRKEDAASIVGEELADEMDKKAKLIGKSEALVMKAEDVPVIVVEEAKTAPSEEDEPEDEEDCCDKNSPAYDEKACAKKKKMAKKSEVVELNEIIRAVVAEMTKPEEVKPIHVLDTVFSEFKSRFDEVSIMSIPADEKLAQLQGAYAKIGEEIKKSVTPPVEEVTPVVQQSKDLIMALSEVMNPIAQKLDLIAAKLASQQTMVQPASAPTLPQIPVRRSLDPSLLGQYYPQKAQSETPNLRALIERTT